MPEFMCFIPVVAFVGFVMLIIYFAQMQAQEANKAWEATAHELGLHHKPGAFMQPRRVDGKYRGQWIQIDTFQRGSGKNSTTYTRYEVMFAESLDLDLRLTRQGFFSHIWTFLGGQDILTGDEDFDKAIMVRGNSPAGVRRFLTKTRRDAIRNLLQTQECFIDDHKIQCCVRGLESSSKRMVSTVQEITRAARILSSYFEEEPPVLSVAHEDHVEEAVEVVRVQPLYDDLVQPAGKDKAAREQRPAARRETPPPLPDWKRREEEQKSRPPARPEPVKKTEPPAETWPPKYATSTPAAETPLPTPEAAPSTPEPAPEIEPPSEDGRQESLPHEEDTALELGAADVCKELFHSDLMTSQISERFEEKYKDRTVRWSGKLAQVSSYYYDMTFGNEPGTKAEVEIYEIDSGIFGAKTVQAVVQLPKDMEETLRSRQGEPITFSGRLAGCDAFMRKLFVADGTIE